MLYTSWDLVEDAKVTLFCRAVKLDLQLCCNFRCFFVVVRPRSWLFSFSLVKDVSGQFVDTFQVIGESVSSHLV